MSEQNPVKSCYMLYCEEWRGELHRLVQANVLPFAQLVLKLLTTIRKSLHLRNRAVTGLLVAPEGGVGVVTMSEKKKKRKKKYSFIYIYKKIRTFKTMAYVFFFQKNPHRPTLPSILTC